MATYDLKTIEDAVLAALQARLGEMSGTLTTYQGDWRADLGRQTWRFPAVLVMLEQSRGEQVGLRSCDLTLDFTVLVAVRNLRGDPEARRGEAGAYPLLLEIREALWFQDLGLALQPLSLLKEEPIRNDQEFSVYAARYRTALVQDL